MIFDLLYAVFSAVFVDPLLAVLPDYTSITPNCGAGWCNDVSTYIHEADAVIPVKAQLIFLVTLISVGVLMVPIMTGVWLYDTLMP